MKTKIVCSDTIDGALEKAKELREQGYIVVKGLYVDLLNRACIKMRKPEKENE